MLSDSTEVAVLESALKIELYTSLDYCFQLILS